MFYKLFWQGSEFEWLFLVNLAKITELLNDKRKPLDFLVQTTSLWFKKVSIPESASKILNGKEESQIMVWFAQTCQVGILSVTLSLP